MWEKDWMWSRPRAMHLTLNDQFLTSEGNRSLMVGGFELGGLSDLDKTEWCCKVGSAVTYQKTFWRR